MESLPKDVMAEMALNLSAPDLISLCSASKSQNRICNSNDFWRRKLEKDYPEELFEFYKSGTPVENPKQVYINKFTFLSRKIEEFVEEFIEKIFQDNFSKFLSKEYKNRLNYKSDSGLLKQNRNLSNPVPINSEPFQPSHLSVNFPFYFRIFIFY